MTRALIAVLLAATFFGFVDDRFRGWEDTNQYQLEAKEWAKGSRPPSPILISETNWLGLKGPSYYPPLVSYSWSKLIHGEDYHESLLRIRLLQAFLLFFSFIAFCYLLNSQFSWMAIFISILVFFNRTFRDFVTIPQSEPFSIFLLLISELFLPLAGAFTVLQFMVRPPMIALHGNSLWRARKSPWVYLGALVTLICGSLFFKNLLKPSLFRAFGLNFSQLGSEWHDFISSLSFNMFEHFIPYGNAFVHFCVGLGFISWTLWIFWQTRRNFALWIGSLIYFLAIIMAGQSGIRYMLPLILIWLVAKPAYPIDFRIKSFFSYGLKMQGRIVLWAFVAILALQHVDRQIEEIFELRRDHTPETESVGLIQTREFIQSQIKPGESLMMYRYRFCNNFFSTPCFGLPPTTDHFREQLKEKNTRFVIFLNIPWQKEDVELQNTIESFLKNHLDIKFKRSALSGITLLDFQREP